MPAPGLLIEAAIAELEDSVALARQVVRQPKRGANCAREAQNLLRRVVASLVLLAGIE